MGPSSLRWLDQDTLHSLASATDSRFGQDRRWITSAVYSPLIISAKALSHELPLLPTQVAGSHAGEHTGLQSAEQRHDRERSRGGSDEPA